MENSKVKQEKIVEEKPPFLSSWRKVYSVVFLNLVVLVILFYLFTKYFG